MELPLNLVFVPSHQGGLFAHDSSILVFASLASVKLNVIHVPYRYYQVVVLIFSE